MSSQSSEHILQPKHTLLKQEEAEKIILKYNVSIIQMPKIKITDPALPKGANVGDLVKVERKDEEGTHVYYRAVVL
jgi:DNA-directed RNA polymerase subunit H